MPTLLSLPDRCHALILLALPDGASLSAAILSHRAFADAARAASVWRPLALRLAWRLRLRAAEAYPSLCLRAARAATAQRLAALGGDRAVDILRLDAAAPPDGQWESAPPLRRGARDAPCAACDGTRVVVVGGWDAEAGVALRTCEAAGVGEAGAAWEWEEGAALPAARCFAGAACDGAARVWVAGGGDSIYRGAQCFAAVDVLERGEWRAGGALRTARCGLALAAEARRDELWACGGYGGGEAYLQTVETFDMATGVGVERPAMLYKRSGLGACFGPDGALYVVGGSEDGANALRSAERLDPREGRWQILPSMLTPRGYLAATFDVSGRLYAVGGVNDVHGMPLSSVEIFDVPAGKWRPGPPMPHPRANLSLVLLA
ncbi:hypothetical protein AB1Y20_011980 [Prymnesium parvum]|uniref:F-box domain-containing protein n=1 Tax=Prymnesium parvum TaxID=97485 RepID=A0AB34IQ09_PRYPA